MVKETTLIHKTFRPAIAMIELIFAIVIIGITLLSAPLVLNQSIKSSTVAMQQESIAAAATQISLILTHNWDESDTNNTYGILNVAAGALALDSVNRDINTSYSTRRYNTIAGFTNATPSENLGMDGNDFNSSDDIDDFHAQSKTLTVYAGEGLSLVNNRGEYIDQNIIMTNTITYADSAAVDYTTNNYVRLNNPFTTTDNSTNIKLINVKLTTLAVEGELDKVIVLGAFTCNIGVPNLTAPQNYRLLP